MVDVQHGQTVCNGACVDIQFNDKQCGPLCQPCGSNQICQNGRCINPCSPDDILCHNPPGTIPTDYCACGSCDNTCTDPNKYPIGSTCQSSSCNCYQYCYL
jgi:hypothetical protein